VADPQLLVLYAITDLLACLTPGPAVMAVTSHALGGSLRSATGAILGINLGNMLWFTLVALGLTAVVHAAPDAFLVLRWLGIAYLAYLGISMWLGAHGVTFEKRRTRTDFSHGMMSAIAVQISNPKALIFFTVFLPPFVDASRPMIPQLAVLAAIAVLIEATVLGGYATLAYRLGQLTMGTRAAHWTGRISGTLLICAALGLAWTGLR
jgi:homoserine/homoserine lactone efflux protein